jgi:hypothetical protein
MPRKPVDPDRPADWRPELPDHKDKTIARSAMARDRWLTRSCAAVFEQLVDRFNRENGRCDPGVKRLMDDTGYSRRSIFGALKNLEQLVE